MSSTQKTSVSHRVVCLDRLAQAVHPRSDGNIMWDGVVSRRLCLILFELPRRVQIGLAVAMAERYLPTFERRHPHLTQLREFLARCLTADPPTDFDVHTWACNLSEEDRGDNHAGRTLIGAAELAAEAAREGALPMTVTSACVLSVGKAIGAGYWEAWEAFDPEAAEASREDIRRSDLELPDLPYNPLQSRNRRAPEVVSAKLAAWEPVVAWLRAANVGQYPDPVDRRTLAKLVRHLNKRFGTWVLYPPHPDMLGSAGQRAALALATGGEADLEALERWAETLDELVAGVAWGTLSLGVRPTEEDVRDARDLVQLVRDGAPREAVVEAAWRVYRFTADPEAVYLLHNVLPWLAGNEEDRSYAQGEAMPPDQVGEWLDVAAAFFERGGNVHGFVPAAEDLSRVRRLRELVPAGGAEEVAEQQRLAKELLDRIPPRWWDCGGPEVPDRRNDGGAGT